MSRHETVISFYRDGVLAHTDDDLENDTSLIAGHNLTIGSKTGVVDCSPGQADDFRVYDRALLDSEVQVLAAVS